MTVPQDTNAALNIQVIPQSDNISLELDDKLILRFTPFHLVITPEAYFAETEEFLRDFTVVHILDDDSECCAYIANVAACFQYTSSKIISTNRPIRNMPNMLGSKYLFIISDMLMYMRSVHSLPPLYQRVGRLSM